MEEKKEYYVRILAKCKMFATVQATDKEDAYEQAQDLMFDALDCDDIKDYEIDIEEIRKEND